MRRREFIGLLGGAAAALPLATQSDVPLRVDDLTLDQRQPVLQKIGVHADQRRAPGPVASPPVTGPPA